MRFLLLLVAFAIGCQSTPMSDVGEKPFQLRPYKEEVLSNGLRLVIVEDQSVPLVNLNLMYMVGSVNDFRGKEGLSAMTSALLDQGTSKRSSTQIAALFNQLGTEMGQVAGHDSSFAQVSGLSASKNQLLELFSETIMNANFPQKEVDRVRSQFIAAISKSADHPPSFANQLIRGKLFSNHPYGLTTFGKVESLKKIQRSDILQFYSQYFRPNNSILALSGQVDEAFILKVKSIFGKWPKRQIEAGLVKKISSPEKQKVILVTKPDLAQSQIRFASLSVKRNDADFLALRLANMVLGGSFASRLNQRIRDDLGLTYSIYSGLDHRVLSGMFEVSTFTRNEKVSEVITHTRKLLQDFVDKGVSQKELAAAKTLLIAQFPNAIETAAQFANQLLLLRLHGVSDNYLFEYAKLVNEVSQPQVNAAIQKHIHPEKMQIVVFADEKKVGDQLKGLGEFSTELWSVQ